MPSASSAVNGSSRIHSGRCTSAQPRKPDAPPLSLRQHAHRQSTLAGERDRVERTGDRLRRCARIVEREPGVQILFGRQFVLERRQVAIEGDGIAQPLRRTDGAPRPASEVSPSNGAVSPAMIRNSVVLPLPFGPVTTSASP